MIAKRLCIIGVGLIGGSLARAVRAAGECEHIIGCGRNEASLQTAQKLGVIDSYSTDAATAVADADVVVLAVPVGAIGSVLTQIRDALAEHAVVTDVGSSKGSVVDAVKAVYSDIPVFFVPGHPIAGTEQSGVEASFAELFQQRRVILTPVAQTDVGALEQVTQLWQCAGAQVSTMSPEHHDAVLAATSHLPHMLAFALVELLNQRDDSDEIFDYAAGGFRDFTRIASSDPVMWRDICLANADALLELVDDYTQGLSRLADMLRNGDADGLLKTFEQSKQARDRFIG
jgi:prephenate dehydrogenase